MSNQWSKDPPNEPGLWYLYGQESFGSMNGHYTGDVHPKENLNLVQVRSSNGGGLFGVSNGRVVELTPFDFDARKCGYLGLWKKVDLSELPLNEMDDVYRSAKLKS